MEEENGIEINGNGDVNGGGEAGDGSSFDMAPLGRCLSSFVDEGSVESHRYYLARRTALEMLRDRGYSVLRSEIDLSLQEFRATHGHNPDIDRLNISAIHNSDPSKRMLVVFCGPGAVKITDLLVNITKHALKPKHQVLTEREKQKLLKNYNIEEKQLPRILKTDAISRYYGLQKGQVVKDSYSGDITESHVTYRCVW